MVPDVADVHVLFRDALKLAEQIETAASRSGQGPRAAASRREILRAYAAFNRDLNDLAKATAADATTRIREQLKLTAKRPDTGVKPHLRDVIRCRPINPVGRGIATGAVGIADEDWLDRAVNPASPQYGPYWMAQEFGSTKQVGRIIRGFFFGTGYSNPDVPRAQYSGGGGPQPIFVSAAAQRALYGSVGISGGAGSQGGVGGFGTIQHPIIARHFIRDGADKAYHDWRAGMRGIEDTTMRQLDPVLRGLFGLGTSTRRP